MNDLYHVIPDLPKGYELDPNRGWFEVIIPEEGTNLCVDPENNTRTQVGSLSVYNSTVVARSSGTAQSRRGYPAMFLSSKRGFHYAKVEWDSLTYPAATVFGASIICEAPEDGVYTVSFDIDVKDSVTIEIIDDPYTTTIATETFQGRGFWQREHVTVELSAGSYLARVSVPVVAAGDYFLMDGLQFEMKPYPTTFFSGSTESFLRDDAAYRWDGAPHASVSYRSANTGSGGKPVNLNEFGLQIIAFTGLGLPPHEIISTNVPGGGEFYQGANMEGRDFSLVAQLSKDSLQGYLKTRSQLESAFHVNRTDDQQEMLLRFHILDCKGTETKILNIPCIYIGGLEGTVETHFGERLVLTFRQTQPYLIEDGDFSQLITVNTIDDVNYIIKRNEDYTYETMGDGFNGTVETICVTSGGTIYAGGSFTASGATLIDRIARWTGTAWEEIGGGLDDTVYVIKEYDPSPSTPTEDYLVIGGAFTMGAGAPDADFIAKYRKTTDAFTTFAITTPGASMTGNACYDIYVDDDVIYFGGDFQKGVPIPLNYVAVSISPHTDILTGLWYNDSNKNVISSGFDNTVRGFDKDIYENIYCVGAFDTTMDNIRASTKRTAQYTGDGLFEWYANSGMPLLNLRFTYQNPRQSVWSENDLIVVTIAYEDDGTSTTFVDKMLLNGTLEMELLNKDVLSSSAGVEIWYYRVGENRSAHLPQMIRIEWGTTTTAKTMRGIARMAYYTGVDIDDPFDTYSTDVIEVDLTAIDGDIVVMSDGTFTMPNTGSVITDGTIYGTGEQSLIEAADTLTLNGNYFAYGVIELNDAESPALNGFCRVKRDRWTGEAGIYKVTDVEINRQVRAICADDRGNVYIGGTFTMPYERIAKWNGSTFEPVGGGLDDHVEIVPMVRTLKWMDDVLYVSGEFERAGNGQQFFNRIATFDNTEWSNLNIRFPGFAQVRAISKADSTKAGYPEKGVAYFGFDTAGIVYVAETTPITYEGTAPSPMVLTGSNEFAYIRNDRGNQVFELSESEHSFNAGWLADFRTGEFRTYDGSILRIAPKSKKLVLHNGENLINLVSSSAFRAVASSQVSTNMRFEPRGIMGVDESNSDLVSGSIRSLDLTVAIAAPNYTLTLSSTIFGNVATTGAVPLTQDWVQFAEVGGSGVSGWFYMAYPEASVNTDIYFFLATPAATEKHKNLYYSIDEAGLW